MEDKGEEEGGRVDSVETGDVLLVACVCRPEGG